MLIKVTYTSKAFPYRNMANIKLFALHWITIQNLYVVRSLDASGSWSSGGDAVVKEL